SNPRLARQWDSQSNRTSPALHQDWRLTHQLRQRTEIFLVAAPFREIEGSFGLRCRFQQRGVEGIDGPTPRLTHCREFQKSAGTERTIEIADEDEGPLVPLGVMRVGSVAGVDD